MVRGNRNSGKKEASGGTYQRRMSLSAADLEKVTGEEGDVERDEELAYGQCTLTFRDVSFSVKDKNGSKRMILEPVSGHLVPGSLVAIMGPSGCGKSTLLDILADKKTAPYEGTVNLNGRPRDHLFGRVTSYVPQKDIVPPHWTVKEAVLFSHCLKNTLPKGVKHETIVRETLRDCSLLHVQDTKIGNEAIRGISGGQKRRVSMARGFCSCAQIIFCDEPTSGLSSTDAETCVKTMRLMSHKFGVIIIVVIHQPRIEIANLFDRLMLFTANPGRMVYDGTMKNADAYLEKIGEPVPEFCVPSDHILDLATPGLKCSRVEKLLECFEKHMAAELQTEVDKGLEEEGLSAFEVLQLKRQRLITLGHIPEVANSTYEANFWKQLKLVFGRKVRLTWRDKEASVMEFVIAVCKAVLLGLSFQNIGNAKAELQLGYFYMLVLTAMFQGFGIIPKDIEERTVMKSETSDGLYRPEAHIIATSVVNGIIQLGAVLVFLVIIFFFSGHDFVMLGWTLMWPVITAICCQSHWSLMAAFAPDATAAAVLTLPWLLLCLFFNGFSMTTKSSPPYLAWLVMISPTTHAMNGLAVAMERTTEGDDQIGWSLVNEALGYKDTMYLSLGVVISWTLLFRILHVRCLQKSNKIDR